MSASVSSAYSVLLPAATVAVFSNHDETRVAVQTLSSDWRFARIKFDIRPGDVTTAITTYTGHQSPNLLIVDTDTIDSGFTAHLEMLANTCSEGTDAVVVGPTNDVALYRYLINLGVGDYLVRPIRPDTIADIIARIVLEKFGSSESQLVAVIGAKGGVGTSTVAELLAYGLAEAKGQKTVIFDGAGGRSYLAVAFGVEPVSTLAEAARAAVAADPSSMNRMLLKAGTQLQVLGTGNDKFLEDPILPDSLERILDRLLAVNPYVIADLSGASAHVQRMILSRANRIMLVSQPTLSSLRLARTLINEVKEMRGGQFVGTELIINMSGFAPGLEVGKPDIEAAIDHKVAAVLPFEPKLVVGAESQSKILGSLKPAEKMMLDLVGCLHLSGRAPETARPGSNSLFDNLMRKVGK
jgi:pilus assembly protein CpaE